MRKLRVTRRLSYFVGGIVIAVETELRWDRVQTYETFLIELSLYEVFKNELKINTKEELDTKMIKGDT